MRSTDNSGPARPCQFCGCETPNTFACVDCAIAGPTTRSLATWVQERFPDTVREWVKNEATPDGCAAPTNETPYLCVLCGADYVRSHSMMCDPCKRLHARVRAETIEECAQAIEDSGAHEGPRLISYMHAAQTIRRLASARKEGG